MIKENASKILSELPKGIELVAAAKGRTSAEIQEAVSAGIKIIGENYIQEAQNAFDAIGNTVKWHFIGHLQRNKVKKAVKVFDMIETVDSFKIAHEIDRQCGLIHKTMYILIEINSGREAQKFGVMPEEALKLIKELSKLKNINIMGLMTMGPMMEDAQEARPYFKETKSIFENLRKHNIENVKMQYLSMGMSNSYKVAIEEGANMVRIGTAIFGER